jgi:hypothetical protein
MGLHTDQYYLISKLFEDCSWVSNFTIQSSLFKKMLVAFNKIIIINHNFERLNHKNNVQVIGQCIHHVTILKDFFLSLSLRTNPRLLRDTRHCNYFAAVYSVYFITASRTNTS